MVDALEIGEAAEQYLAEGSYVLALEKFQSCLSVLVPLLGKEPIGRRRDLLHKQVIRWILRSPEVILDSFFKIFPRTLTQK